MILLLTLIITEILTFLVLHEHLYGRSVPLFYTALIINVILSIWIWILYISVATHSGYYDDPEHIWLLMSLNGTIVAIVAPRAILSLFHFSGKIIRRKRGGHIRWLTNTGIILMIFIMSVIGTSTLKGRFNFKTEYVTITIPGLKNDLSGLKIVLLSDLHLSCFHHHPHILQEVVEEVNRLKPDLVLNTGDFISYGWREYGRNDTILAKTKSLYGNYAVMGNHDFGTYLPSYNETEGNNTVLIMNDMTRASGYKVLNNEHAYIDIGEARIAIIGITTVGRHPDISYGSLQKALTGIDNVDLKILLSHDPNFWEKAVTGKTGIDITLAGHTHGMQMGIMTSRFKWSPSKYYYPHWNGLFSTDNQYLYVNRGLGVLAIPFRIWMPPEITVISLK